MLFPKKVKHRKWQTARLSEAKLARPETRGITVAFGSFGLKAESMARVTSAQIESARKAMRFSGGNRQNVWRNRSRLV